MLVFNEENNEKLSKVYEGESIKEEYVKDAKRASMEDDIVGLYDKELHEEMLMITELEEARGKGFEAGKKESILETAKNMLKDNLDIEMISKYTELTKEEMNNLK